MSAIDELLEARRQAALGDGRYIRAYPYALELRCPEAEEPQGRVVFVFPLGPNNMTVKRSFGQTVVPTLGGVVAEERGIIWKDFTVSGHFGLAPKTGIDTTSKSPTTAEGHGPMRPGDRLSGPLWVKRMVAHIFERYGQLKADQTTSAQTVLIWHNFRDEESLIVVPSDVTITRDVSTRFMYPFDLAFKAIAPADRLVLPADAVPASIVASKNIIRTVTRALGLVTGGLQEATGFVGEIRYFFSTIDNIIDQVGIILASVEDFATGVTDTVDVGTGMFDSVLASMDDLLAFLESDAANPAGIVASATIPDDARQVFAGMQDGLHDIRATLAVFANSYRDEMSAYTLASQGLNRSAQADLDAAAAAPVTAAAGLEARSILPGDRARVAAGALPAERTFPEYTGYTTYVVQSGDQIQVLAARFLGDGDRWADIAALNGLKPPYVSWAGGPCVARPGDTLLIPRITGPTSTRSASVGTTEEDLFGVDLRLQETSNSRPGRPAVDLVVDTRTRKDFATIGGINNLVQAVQLRVWTARGSMPHYPGYGMPAAIGFGNTEANVTAIKVGLRSTLLQDSRIDRVLAIRSDVDGDSLALDADVLPVGSTSPTTLQTVVV